MGAWAAVRRRNPGHSMWRILLWSVIRATLWVVQLTVWQHRWWGSHRVPARGPVVLVSNHQSYLDLSIIAMGLPDRHFHPMAEAYLFENRWFAWLIRSLNAFRVEQGKGDIAAIRTAIARLNEGHVLTVFAEGRRTSDGAVDVFHPGIMTVVKRARPTVVPVAIEGAFDVWPRSRKLPRLQGTTALKFGKAIDPETLLAMEPKAAMGLLRDRVDAMRLELRADMRRRLGGRFPPPGVGDG